MSVRSAANSGTFAATTPSDLEIRLTRLFDAPRALVIEAMSKPEHIRRWWGCLGEGYSVPVCEVDFRVGGQWRLRADDVERVLAAAPQATERTAA